MRRLQPNGQGIVPLSGWRRPVVLAPLGIVLLAGLSAFNPAGTAFPQAPASLRLPFPAGTSWKVFQGYFGGTHTAGPEQYALDLVRQDAPTAGTDVLSPAAGSLWWMSPPGEGNGCVLITVAGTDGLMVELCHIIAARTFRRDERIDIGQYLGSVGAAGLVGNNGLAHLHLSLHRTWDYGVTRIPAPFALPDGLPLEGVAMPADGTANEYVCPGRGCLGAMLSTNLASPHLAGSSPAEGAPAVSAVLSAPAPPIALRAGVTARVVGGGCLNLRDGPGLSASVLACLPDGTTVTVSKGPAQADGRTWWQLDEKGWAAGEYLAGVAAPPAVLQVGSGVVVDAGVRDCLNLRAAPGTAADVLACLPSGARMTITAGPRDTDGHTWWQLDGRGWVAGDYLKPLDDG